jgi:hypothetical protein
MIYDINSQLFRSFLSAAGASRPKPGGGDGQQRRPGEGKKDNKPPMME